jgi:hypothetical protein
MCTQCHAALSVASALKEHAHHDPAGEGARCIGCHMPRIVYGVLDIHRSHRIDGPQTVGDRPDACVLCHVAGVGSRQGALQGIVAVDPVVRAVYTDALGRAPEFTKDERARRFGALLDLMADDTFPAIRDLAWRGVRRLAAPGAPAGTGPAADFDPSGDRAARTAVVQRARAELLPGRPSHARSSLADLLALHPGPDLEMGE